MPQFIFFIILSYLRTVCHLCSFINLRNPINKEGVVICRCVSGRPCKKKCINIMVVISKIVNWWFYSFEKVPNLCIFYNKFTITNFLDLRIKSEPASTPNSGEFSQNTTSITSEWKMTENVTTPPSPSNWKMDTCHKNVVTTLTADGNVKLFYIVV